MSENAAAINSVDTLSEDTIVISKKIGSTTYVVASRFNGNKRMDMASTLVRLMERDVANAISETTPEIGA